MGKRFSWISFCSGCLVGFTKEFDTNLSEKFISEEMSMSVSSQVINYSLTSFHADIIPAAFAKYFPFDVCCAIT